MSKLKQTLLLCVCYFGWLHFSWASPNEVLPTIQKISGIAYGTDPAQQFDVYLPPNVTRAPVLFMVHGGGWDSGDKAIQLRYSIKCNIGRLVAMYLFRLITVYYLKRM